MQLGGDRHKNEEPDKNLATKLESLRREIDEIEVLEGKQRNLNKELRSDVERASELMERGDEQAALAVLGKALKQQDDPRAVFLLERLKKHDGERLEKRLESAEKQLESAKRWKALEGASDGRWGELVRRYREKLAEGGDADAGDALGIEKPIILLEEEVEVTKDLPKGSDLSNLSNKNLDSNSVVDAYGTGGGAAGAYGQRWRKGKPGDLKGAITDYERAIQLNGKLADVRNGRGRESTTESGRGYGEVHGKSYSSSGKRDDGRLGELSESGTTGLIDEVLGSGTKSGYAYNAESGEASGEQRYAIDGFFTNTLKSDPDHEQALRHRDQKGYRYWVNELARGGKRAEEAKRVLKAAEKAAVKGTKVRGEHRTSGEALRKIRAAQSLFREGDKDSGPFASGNIYGIPGTPTTTGDRSFATNKEGVTYFTSKSDIKLNSDGTKVPAGMLPVGKGHVDTTRDAEWDGSAKRAWRVEKRDDVAKDVDGAFTFSGDVALDGDVIVSSVLVPKPRSEARVVAGTELQFYDGNGVVATPPEYPAPTLGLSAGRGSGGGSAGGTLSFDGEEERVASFRLAVVDVSGSMQHIAPLNGAVNLDTTFAADYELSSGGTGNIATMSYQLLTDVTVNQTGVIPVQNPVIGSLNNAQATPLQLVRSLDAASPTQRPAVFNRLLGSIQQIRAEDPRLAVYVLRRLRKYAPQRLKVHEQLGLSYLALGEREAALRAFSGMVEASPDDAEAHWVFARALVTLRLPRRALVEAREAMRLRPDLARYRLGRAELAASLKRYDEAERVLRRVLSTNFHPEQKHVVAEATRLLGSVWNRQLRANPRPAARRVVRLTRALQALQQGVFARRAVRVRLGTRQGQASLTINAPGEEAVSAQVPFTAAGGRLAGGTYTHTAPSGGAWQIAVSGGAQGASGEVIIIIREGHPAQRVARVPFTVGPGETKTVFRGGLN